MIGPFELFVLLFLVFLVLGPRRITRMLRSAGRGIGDFKNQLEGTAGGEKNRRDS